MHATTFLVSTVLAIASTTTALDFEACGGAGACISSDSCNFQGSTYDCGSAGVISTAEIAAVDAVLINGGMSTPGVEILTADEFPSDKCETSTPSPVAWLMKVQATANITLYGFIEYDCPSSTGPNKLAAGCSNSGTFVLDENNSAYFRCTLVKDGQSCSRVGGRSSCNQG